MSRVWKVTALAVLLGIVAAVAASAHSGGLDANGGHHDRKNGGYHYHRGGGGGSSGGGGTRSESVATSLYTPVDRISADVTPGRRSGELASLEINSADDSDSGTFYIEKRTDGAYALRYKAEDSDGKTSVTFFVEPEGVEEFADLLDQLVKAE